MSTTSVFVELLIGGIQSTLWIVLLASSIFKTDWLDQFLEKFSSWSGIATIAILALWYTVGIIIDRIGVIVFQRILNPKKLLMKIGWIAKNAKENKNSTSIALLLREGNLSSYLDYYRSRVRIMRFTILNSFLITISMVILVYTNCNLDICASKNSIALWIAIIGIGFVFLTWLLLGMLEIGYDGRVEQARFALAQAKEKKKQ